MKSHAAARRPQSSMFKQASGILLCLFFNVLVISASEPPSPEEILTAMEVHPSFEVSVFAAEPDVIDPVAMAFDERGRLYVCEMTELEKIPAEEPGVLGAIRLIEDVDGDGRADRATVFADGLSFPGGIAVYDGGVFALCTPDLFYLKDTDGDGRADVKRVVRTGFTQGNAEHRFNNLKWGMDNWIYAANGHGGGKIYDPAKPEEKLDLGGADLRFDPRTETFELEARQIGGGFGLTFDDWGRRYVDQNEMHVIHVALPGRYLGRNPNLAIRDASQDISDHGKPDAKVYPTSKPQDWRVERTSQRAQTMASKFTPTQLQANGFFTAACGVTVYRGAWFPEEFRGDLFVCDAAQNLIHRDRLTEQGAAMVASRTEHETEFLRCSNHWFRPTNLECGPDGALYVADACRDIIETAASIPPDILAKIDIQAGNKAGRIFRIVPKEISETNAPRDLAGLKDKTLVELLNHPSAWHRLTAQRSLIERKAEGQVEAIKVMAKSASDPLGRIHALWTLEGLKKLDDATILAAMKDSDARVREQAVILAENALREVKSGK